MVNMKFTTSHGHGVKVYSGIVTNQDNNEVEVRFMKEVNVAGCSTYNIWPDFDD